MMGFVDAVLDYSLRGLHSLIWLRENVALMLLWLWTSILYPVKHKGTKLECIQTDVKKLKKLPLHLALIVVEEEMSHLDLARLVTWSFSFGVHNVSLYDPNGELRAHLVPLRGAITSEYQQLFSPPIPDVQVYSADNLPHRSNSSELTNCHVGTSNTVFVLSPEDGRQDVVTMATNICHLVVQRQLRVEDIDPATVASKITALSGVPDPDLAVVIGPTSSMVGYPPWQMRVAEILSLTTHHKVCYQDFYEVLWKYANTQQRFGK